MHTSDKIIDFVTMHILELSKFVVSIFSRTSAKAEHDSSSLSCVCM